MYSTRGTSRRMIMYLTNTEDLPHQYCTPSLIITLYNVCAVPWRLLSTVGVFSTVGDIISTMGDILSTMGVFSTVRGYHDKCGGYLEYRGGVQYRGGYHEYHGVILSTVGDIMMHVGIS